MERKCRGRPITYKEECWCFDNDLIDHCLYRGAELEVPEHKSLYPLKTEIVREWLHKQRGPMCCVNMLQFDSIINQVETQGVRGLSPENCRIYQDLAVNSGMTGEAPVADASRNRYCRDWISHCDCSRIPFPKIPFPQPEKCSTCRYSAWFDGWEEYECHEHSVRATRASEGFLECKGKYWRSRKEPDSSKIEVSREMLKEIDMEIWRARRLLSHNTQSGASSAEGHLIDVSQLIDTILRTRITDD